MPLAIEVRQEEDGRWLAEVSELPGVMAYGRTRPEALDRAEALAFRVLADRLKQGDNVWSASKPTASGCASSAKPTSTPTPICAATPR